ncbi:MAG TPA: hypothetical protein VKD71_00215 [Gemmataceae bacterium]|nr:hypothetical protein [Gemmataceae bacterium]
MPAPPIPDPPADPIPLTRPGPAVETSPAAAVRPPLPATDDPFQRAPRDKATTDDLSRASAAFAAKRYSQAAAHFVEADRHTERFTDTQREEWAYCRLYGVAVQLNSGSEPTASLASLKREVESAAKTGSPRLKPFANQLLAEIERRGPAARPSSVEPGWESVESGSFRVLYKGRAVLANEVSRTAEAARKAMYERWAGPVGSPWTPRCDIYLHPTGADYANATGKPADQLGHSTVGTKGGRVVSRRIDLRADEPAILDGALPSEVTQVALADLFADEPLPRWAIVGMSALAESPEGVARYRRAVPALLREKKLFAVGPFMDRADFPGAANVTPSFAESVSLVSYLVELRGPKAFAAFLREAPRRGYAKALTSQYGFKDAADLQDRWVKHELGGE